MSVKTMTLYKIWRKSNVAVLLSLLSSVSLTTASNVAGCNGTNIEIPLHNTTSSGNLSSPNYPDWIPANSSCVWILTCPAGRLIKLYLNEVMFNTTTTRNHSYLEIHDGVGTSSPLIVNVTAGNENNDSVTVFYSSGQKLSLHLKKGLREASGSMRFRLSYSSIKPGKTCSSNNSEDVNNNILLTTPFLLTIGDSLSSKVDCTWKITPSAIGVLMNITLDIKKNPFCSTGSVFIFDGPYGPASKLKHNLCQEPRKLSSFTSDVGLSFHLKSSNFSSILQIQASEDGCIKWPDRYMTKNMLEGGQPLPKTRCQRKFSNPSGHLLFNIFYLNLPPGCENNSVELLELHKNSSKPTLRAKFCETSFLLPKIIVYSGQAMIKVKTDVTGDFHGFMTYFYPNIAIKGFYHCSQYNSPEENANLIRTNHRDYLESPMNVGGGNIYPPGMLCRWRIVPTNVTDKQQIKMSFRRFDFSRGYDKNCAQDHIQFDFGNGRIQKYCKATGNPSVIYSGNAKSVSVTFVATPLYTGNRGFSLFYEVVPFVPSPPGKRLSWAVIGVLIGVGCLLVACIAFGIYRWKRKRQQDRVMQRMTNERDEQEDTLPEEQEMTTPIPQGPPPPYTGKDEDSQLLQQPTGDQPYPWFSPGTTIMEHSPRETRPAPEIESKV